ALTSFHGLPCSADQRRNGLAVGNGVCRETLVSSTAFGIRRYRALLSAYGGARCGMMPRGACRRLEARWFSSRRLWAAGTVVDLRPDEVRAIVEGGRARVGEELVPIRTERELDVSEVDVEILQRARPR